ncbi:MAG: hypothetical protein ACI870_000527 [Crocinitomicaceae bacterium]|jgi:hypothetical protein
MDKEFKTTFIPKRNLSGAKAPESKKSKAARSLIGLIALLLFFTALVATAGVYIWKARLAAVVNSRINSINLAEKAFEPAVILDLKKLDIRLQAGTKLLSQHVAISDFLESLAESTLPDVSFSGFSTSLDLEGAEVSMEGEARGYLQIAQQSDVFEDNQYIQNHIFSNFSLTDVGRITFSLQFTINPELISFGRTVKNDEPNITNSENIIIPDPNSGQIPSGIDVNYDGIIQ